MTADPQSLRRQLRRTWPHFFARHGNFTEIQRLALPPLLAGHSALMMAATAAGKTEAAVAPLIERLLNQGFGRPPAPPTLRILYICPTRALTSDLYARLTPPLAALGIALDMKTADAPGLSWGAPPALLITTPESTDSLLTRAPRLFGNLSAVVIDEVHLFDGTPRGDHLRCLLERIDQIRDYHAATQPETSVAPLQRLALSATVPDPAGVAARFLGSEDDVVVVRAAGRRTLDADTSALPQLEALPAQIGARAAGAQGSRKMLLFCNTRNEVEATAAFLRTALPFDAKVLVHYSNLDPALRRQVEADFTAAKTAICVCTSTLELGIDIGTVDDVILLGPPPSLSSFLQRIGRGGRRHTRTRVLCLYRTRLEDLRFHALLGLARGEIDEADPLAYHFRPSVLVQQIFSRLKQSPTGAVRLADIARIAPEPLATETLRALVGELVQTGYLRRGRPGEWRPGPALDELLDAHEIYSNIGADPRRAEVVDAFSGRVLATTERFRQPGETLLLGGRLVEVLWRDGRRLGVRSRATGADLDSVRFVAAPFALPLDVSLAMAASLGLPPNSLTLVADEGESLLFHFWGEVYGTLLAQLLQRQITSHARGGAEDYLEDHDDPPPRVDVVSPICLRLPEAPVALPPWREAEAQRALHYLLPQLEPFLDLGRFHALLPPDLARETALALCDLPHFERLYRSAVIVPAGADLRRRLIELL